MSHPGRRFATGLVAALAVASAVVPLSPASATKDFSFTRFAGQNRYDTARKIAEGSGFGVVQNVVLATGENFPDALAGNYLAAALGSPILLTQKDSLPAETKTALVGVQAKSVTLLGGTSAISAAVENDLKGNGYDVRRIAGANRYDTAAAAARQAALTSAVGSVASKKTAFVATGEGFADALAAGPSSYAGKLPILLTTPNTLSSQTKQAIQDLKVEQVIVLGGTGAVSTAVEAELKATPGVTGVARILGADRTQTATSIAQFAITNLAFDQTHVNLARGDQFADALAGGPHGGRELASTLLSASSTTLDAGSGANTTFLRAYASKLEDGHIFGGASAVSDTVEKAALAAAGAAPPEAADGTYQSVKVQEVAYEDDYFVSADVRSFQYDGGTYQFKGTSLTAKSFEDLLNPDDILDVTYKRAGGSTFNITVDNVHAVPAPTARYHRTTETIDGIGVTVAYPSNNSPGTTYTVFAVPIFPGCGGQAVPESSGEWETLTSGTVQSAVGGKTITYVHKPASPPMTPFNCWAYLVDAKSPAPSGLTARGAMSNQRQWPAPASGADPYITSATLEDKAPTGFSKDDVHIFQFSETMDPESTTTGTTGYRLQDEDGTTVDIICGVNARCVLDNNNFAAVNNQPTQVGKITVTLTSVPTASGGTISGFQYGTGGEAGTSSRITATFEWYDATGDPVDLTDRNTASPPTDNYLP